MRSVGLVLAFLLAIGVAASASAQYGLCKQCSNGTPEICEDAAVGLGWVNCASGGPRKLCRVWSQCPKIVQGLAEVSPCSIDDDAMPPLRLVTVRIEPAPRRHRQPILLAAVTSEK
jgi:hypothetical protein